MNKSDDVKFSSSSESSDVESARRQADRALRLVCGSLPWLSGLAHVVQIIPDVRVAIAGVTASGRVLINPTVFASGSLDELTFVMAHELLHLALNTHGRESARSDHDTVNIAHDYIINDMLREELRMSPPFRGLDLQGCSKWSLERMVIWMKYHQSKIQRGCWTFQVDEGSEGGAGNLSGALREAGLLPKTTEKAPDNLEWPDLLRLGHFDVITAEMEQIMFPGEGGVAGNESRADSESRIEEVRRGAEKAYALLELTPAIIQQCGLSGSFVRQSSAAALRGRFSTPWEVALQRWMEASSPSGRTYSRPSRRGANLVDCVLPGRNREGWTLHLVLDTSGSMTQAFSSMLGAIAMFCESAGVADVHILQCDTSVTVDEWITVEEFQSYRIAGYGGSDMSPAMNRLADDPEVTAVIVLTDGCIQYPKTEPPYRVLWVLPQGYRFWPTYGEVLNVR